jgi:hypothetical protein
MVGTRFSELRAFKKQFGHCKVPKHWAPNPVLGDWVSTQRTQRDKISAQRRRRLAKLGFVWQLTVMSPAITWDERFQELAIYKKRFGHCEVPPTWPENQPLAEWTRRQRGRDMKKLSAEQRRRLTDLGFCWTPRESNWEQRFGELQNFWQTHGHCNVPRRWMNDPHLRGWALRQRYRAQTLSAERVRKLDRLNFKWLGAKRGVTRSRISGRFVESSVQVGSAP